MRKTCTAMAAVVLLCIPVAAICMEPAVVVSGQSIPGITKEWVASTIVTRCMARGVDLEAHGRLEVTIVTLGDISSVDAVLQGEPPVAFHKDVHAPEGISGAIDEMIESLFVGARRSRLPATPTPGPGGAPGNDGRVGATHSTTPVELPFTPTSIAWIGEAIFVSDMKRIHKISDGAPKEIWKAPGASEILRITPHENGLLVVTKTSDTLKTFFVRDSRVEETWDGAVLPLGPGLVSTRLRLDRDLDATRFRWERPSIVMGSPALPPEGADCLNAVVLPAGQKDSRPTIVSYGRTGRIALWEGGELVWEAEEGSGVTPLSIESRPSRVQKTGSEAASTETVRYALSPRIAVAGPRIVTFVNEQGSGGIFPRLNLFSSSEVVAYEQAGNALERRSLASFKKGHCVDIAVVGKQAAVLVVEGKKSFVRFVEL